MSQHPTPWRVETVNGWPHIVCADGNLRWPDSVWRSGSAGREHQLLSGIVKAVNWARGQRDALAAECVEREAARAEADALRPVLGGV